MRGPGVGEQCRRAPDRRAVRHRCRGDRRAGQVDVVGRDGIEPPTLWFSAGCGSFGSVGFRPPKPYSPCSAGIQADSSSGVIRVRPRSCGPVGQNAGRTAKAPPRVPARSAWARAGRRRRKGGPSSPTTLPVPLASPWRLTGSCARPPQERRRCSARYGAQPSSHATAGLHGWTKRHHRP
jgi:hypothetical protein